MPASTVIKHLHDGSLVIKDGTGTPVTHTIPFSVGDFSLSGLRETQRSVIAYETRGTLHTIRHGAREYPTGSFSCQIADYSDATQNTLLDFLRRSGSYSANVSSILPTEVYAVDLVWTVEGTNLGDAADHVITLQDCVCSFDLGEGEPNTLTVNFTVYGAITIS